VGFDGTSGRFRFVEVKEMPRKDKRILKGKSATRISQAKSTALQTLQTRASLRKLMVSTDHCGTTFPFSKYLQKMENQPELCILCAKFPSIPGKSITQVLLSCQSIDRCSAFFRKKFELATKEPLNPIKQDDSTGYLATFKKGDIYFNYGCFPRFLPNLTSFRSGS
jgi:hypothetical protein